MPVYLIGAGPGDPDLITLKAVKALNKADVVLYDYLANEEILKHAPENAKRIYVGKKAGEHYKTQDEINQLIIEEAKENENVIRLKGGDPFVFGRGGEELLALAKENIDFEVIPGVTSAIGAPTSMAFPITHRAVATSFTVVTGHEDPTKKDKQVKWDYTADTLIILMGIGCMIEGHYAWWTGPNNWWCSEYYYMNEATWWMKEKVFWFHGEWWVNSAPAFLTGLVFANYEKKIVAFFKENYWKRFFILVIITEVCFAISDIGQSKFGYWTEFNLKGPEIGNKLATYFCQVPLFLILPVTIYIFLMKYHVSNPISRFFGKYSLHTYLVNLMAITLFRFLEFNSEGSPFYMGGKYNNLFVYAIFVILFTVAFGVGEYKLTTWVQEKLFGGAKVVVEPSSRVSLLDDEDDKYARKMSMFRKEAAVTAPQAVSVTAFETVEETSLKEKPKKKKKEKKKKE